MADNMLRKYVVRNGHEWAVIILDLQQGGFYCQSSYGTYAHIWAHRGKGVTLWAFLRKLDFDYFMKKTCPGYEKFDLEWSVRGVKDAIKERRKGGVSDVSKQDARDAWYAIEDIESYADSQNETHFIDALYRTKEITEVLGYDELYDYARRSPTGDARGFWEKIWPEFLKQIAPKPKVGWWKRFWGWCPHCREYSRGVLGACMNGPKCPGGQ